MSDRIRVLLVDDSVVIRRAIASTLAVDPEFEVVATAQNGLIALTRLGVTEVDAVVLDIEMPELDGLATLERIRARWPRLPVIMCSTLTERGAAVTVEALALGATDYVTKPTGQSSMAAALESLGTQLRAKLKAATRPAPPLPPRAARPVIAVPTPASRVRTVVTPEVVTVATSTGGPNALLEFLSSMPELPVPMVIVQHMPPFFTKLLAERLSTARRRPVREGEENAALAPGDVWIAPGGRHMEVVRQGDRVLIHLQDGAPENSCRPAADVLFRSVARVYGPAAMGVVLTGMGQDGLEGSRALVAAGGSVVVQDETTSVVWGMPGYVAREGLASAVLPLGEIGSAVVRGLRGASAASSPMRIASGNPRDRFSVRT